MRSTTFLFISWCTLVAKIRVIVSQTVSVQHFQKAHAPWRASGRPQIRCPRAPFLGRCACRGRLEVPPRFACRAVRHVGPAGQAPDRPPVRSLSRELHTACCRGQDPVPPLHSSRRRKEDRATGIKGWHCGHPRGPAAHGPSRPPAPLEVTAASSGFQPAAHPTKLSSTYLCICYSFPSHPFACPGRELAEEGGTAAGAGHRCCMPSPAEPPPRPNPQTDAWWAPSHPPPFPRPIPAPEHRNLGRRRRQPCPRTQFQVARYFQGVLREPGAWV
jgi:hypothetical protein